MGVYAGFVCLLSTQQAVKGQPFLEGVQSVYRIPQQPVPFPGGHVAVHAGGEVAAFRQPPAAPVAGKGPVDPQSQGIGGKLVVIVGIVQYDLLELGIDALHPLQAQASGMDAGSLRQYRGKLLFVGGVDTQQLLPNADPETVRTEVLRLHEAFGDFWIASPSHEGILPNIPLENISAIREAAELLGKEGNV